MRKFNKNMERWNNDRKKIFQKDQKIKRKGTEKERLMLDVKIWWNNIVVTKPRVSAIQGSQKKGGTKQYHFWTLTRISNEKLKRKDQLLL